MSTITTIQATDQISNSRAVINTNFANLNSDKQEVNANLTAISGLASAANKLPYFTGSGTASLTDLTAFARTFLDDADASTMRSTLGLVIGTNVQAYDDTLASIAALGTAANKIAYTTGVDTWAETALTAFARSIIDDADEATFKATVNLEIGTDVQAYNAGLADIAGLAKTDSNFIVGNGTNWVAESGATARTSLGLGNVEDTALSTWAGTTNITTLGTVGTGTWNATAIGATKGGTGLTTVPAGSVLIANAADTVSALQATTGTRVLKNNAGTISWVAGTGSANEYFNSAGSFAVPDHVGLSSIGLNSHDELDSKLEEDETVEISSVASKGGVFNGGFEVSPPYIAATNTDNRWIDGTSGGSTTNDRYGLAANISGSAEARFDSGKAQSGNYSLKLSVLSPGSFIEVIDYIPNNSVEKIAKYGTPIKPNTSYRYSFWLATRYVSGDATRGAFLTINQYSNSSASAVAATSSTAVKTTADYTLYTGTFTSNVNAAYIMFNRAIYGHEGAGTLVMDAWFDGITIEEVYTSTVPVTVPTRPDLTVVAVSSTDNVDQSLDAGGAYANTYALPTSIDEGATHRQTFTPTKGKTARIGVWIVDKGTGNWTLTVHDASNALKAAQTITNANLTNGAFNYFYVSNEWTSGAYHFHLTSTVADATVKTNTSNDLEAASFRQDVNKRTEMIGVTHNGVPTLLKADKYGFLNGASIRLKTGKLRWLEAANGTEAAYNNVLSLYSYQFSTISSDGTKSFTGSGDHRTYKFNTGVPIKHFRFRVLTNSFADAGEQVLLQYSVDRGATWTTYITHTYGSVTNETSPWAETDLFNGKTEVWFRAAWGAGSYQCYAEAEADLDTSALPIGTSYPFALNQFTENVVLPSSATRIYFRTAKFQNAYGVVMPALEYTDASGNYIGYTPLRIDNSQETNPAIDIIVAETTNGQQSGTGSNDSTTGYILNDGEYMTLSSATASLAVTYKVGGGTTSFADITKHAFYFSSNGEGDDATQDPSHQATWYLGIPSHGLKQEVGAIKNEIQDVKANLLKIQEYSVTVAASGTTGTATVPIGSRVLGIYPVSNQDQFVDSVAISGNTLTVTLAAAATADNVFKVVVIEL